MRIILPRVHLFYQGKDPASPFLHSLKQRQENYLAVFIGTVGVAVTVPVWTRGPPGRPLMHAVSTGPSLWRYYSSALCVYYKE